MLILGYYGLEHLALWIFKISLYCIVLQTLEENFWLILMLQKNFRLILLMMRLQEKQN